MRSCSMPIMGMQSTQLLNGHNVPEEKVRRKGFSCSTFMLYLGLDTLYEDEPHHQILFADDYRRNLNEIQEEADCFGGHVDLRAELVGD